jgi:hypothetical protein
LGARARPDGDAPEAFALAKTFDEPCYGLLHADANALTWQVFDAAGALQDTATVAKGEPPVRTYSFPEIQQMEQRARRAREQAEEADGSGRPSDEK